MADEQEKLGTLLAPFVELLIPKEAKPKEALDAEKPNEASEAEKSIEASSQKQNLISKETNVSTLLTLFLEKLIQLSIRDVGSCKIKRRLGSWKTKRSLLAKTKLAAKLTYSINDSNWTKTEKHASWSTTCRFSKPEKEAYQLGCPNRMTWVGLEERYHHPALRGQMQTLFSILQSICVGEQTKLILGHFLAAQNPQIEKKWTDDESLGPCSVGRSGGGGGCQQRRAQPSASRRALGGRQP